MHLKKLFQEKEFLLYTEGPWINKKSVKKNWNIFFRYILQLKQVKNFDIYVKFCVFWMYDKTLFWRKKIFYLY
jgi:hypothetical protein